MQYRLNIFLLNILTFSCRNRIGKRVYRFISGLELTEYFLISDIVLKHFHMLEVIAPHFKESFEIVPTQNISLITPIRQITQLPPQL